MKITLKFLTIKNVFHRINNYVINYYFGYENQRNLSPNLMTVDFDYFLCKYFTQ